MIRRVNAGIKFTEKQRKAWNLLINRQYTRILFDGGARSGKTSLLTQYLLIRALKYPGSRQLIARKHRVHARQSIWNDTLKKFAREFLPENIWRKSETEMTLFFPNQSEIIVGGLDDAERVEKILGNEFITVMLNEATQLSWHTVQMIMTRLAQSVKDLDGGLAVPKLIMDCNPRGPRHWLFLAGVRHLDPETQEPFRDSEKWARLNWSAYDNTENLPKEYLKTLEALPEVMRDRMLKGVWRSNEGAVYDEFNEDIHVVDDFNIPADWKRIRSVDFGYTNPFVCLWGALDPDGRLYLYREHYQAKVRTALHAEKIKKLSENEKIFLTVADHDAGERAELQAGGIYTQPAKKNVQQGIQAVKNRLAVQEDGKPRLFFCKSMSNTLSEIYDYLWEPDNGDLNAKEAPVKMNDHAMDALRYMVMGIDTGSPNYHGTCSTSGSLDERWN